MRNARLVALLLACTPALAEDYSFGPPDAAEVVTVYSSLDVTLAEPLIAGFLTAHPGIGVSYSDLLTGEIAARILSETATGATADLAISSAMDLQVKLANDGLAMALDLPELAGWPDWANWRDTAIAFTFEPAVIVYHKPSFPDGPPVTRAGLVRWLAKAPPGRVGTYDITAAAVGYLFLARDQEHYADIWSLVAALGRAGVVLSPTSQGVIEAVASGELALGYNILGSYAAEQARRLPDLGIALPQDFTVVVARVALVPEAARRPDLGANFLAFLLSDEGQRILAEDMALPALSPGYAGPNSAAALRAAHGAILKPVPVGPGLLAYLDQSRRARFLERWQTALGR
jgi:iron(III) transport system substrate-binding protein